MNTKVAIVAVKTKFEAYFADFLGEYSEITGSTAQKQGIQDKITLMKRGIAKTGGVIAIARSVTSWISGSAKQIVVEARNPTQSL
jgi:hypothetical protein